MITSKADIEKNRLYIILSGVIDVAEAKKAMLPIVKEAHKLKPKFDVITDFSGLKSADNRTKKILRSIMNYLSLQGVGRVVRIVGGAKAMLLKFADFTRGFKGYKIDYVPTIEDAEKKLAN
jgi:hypothetical protein